MFTRALALAIFAIFALPGCRTKPSAAFHQGSGPTIHYHEAETAGGPVRSTRFR